MPLHEKKVVAVLPAYNAEKTLKATYDDIPKDWVDEILLVDDCSHDRTVELSRELGIVTIVHGKNRGYGGNQKTCYRTAMDQMGADIMVMVHPDHQYDPTIIPELVKPLLEGECDAVFGSRMLGGRPIEGGMPKWKYFANLFLTMVENATFYVFLSEYHSGFPRLFTALSRVDRLRSELGRFRVRHRDHRPGRVEAHAHPGSADPDALLRRSLPDRILALRPLRPGDPEDDGAVQAAQEAHLLAPDLPRASSRQSAERRARRAGCLRPAALNRHQQIRLKRMQGVQPSSALCALRSRSVQSRPVYESTEPQPPSDFPLPSTSAPSAAVNRRHDVLAIVALVLLATIAFGDVIVGAEDFYLRDMTRYYYPAKQILREIVLHGEFPLWNRYFSAGQPIAANPEHEVFYPLTWLILLPSYDLGYRLHILIHIYIGLLGMYFLLRSMELRPYASFFGAFTWGLGGLYLSYINLLPILFCVAWLPLTCLFVRRFLLQRNRRDFALAALFLGIQFLVGEPTTILQTGFLIGVYALYRAWYSRPRLSKSISRVLWIALISSAGLLIGSAQILPGIDHVHDSARSRAFGFDLVSAWSMPWAKYAELLYPNILGHLSVKHVTWYWGGGLYPGMGSPFLFSIYCGLLAIALVIGGAFARPRGGRLVLLIALVSSILALGSHTPLLKWCYDAGIATSVRYPEKFALMGIFALIIFSAQMLQRMLDGDETVREGALGFTLAVLLVATFVAVTTFTPSYARAMAKIWSITAGPAGNTTIAISKNDWWFAVMRGVAVALLLLTVRTRRRTVWLAIAALVVIADVLPVGEEINPRMPRRFFDPPPAANLLPKNHSDYRLFHEVDWYGQEEIARKFFSAGSGVYWVVRNGLFPMTPSGSGIRDGPRARLRQDRPAADDRSHRLGLGREALRPERLVCPVHGHVQLVVPRRVSRLRQGEQAHQRRLDEVHSRDLPAGAALPPLLLRRPDRHDQRPQRFRQEAQREQLQRAGGVRAAARFVPADGVVRSVRESANSATLDVESFGQAFLVMSVTPHKYWGITIDDRTVPAIVTNIGYQGITVTPGRHRVVMRYSNPLVKVGGAISIATLLVLLLLIVTPHRTRDRSQGLPAYEEPMHVVADATGTHVEPSRVEET